MIHPVRNIEQLNHDIDMLCHLRFPAIHGFNNFNGFLPCFLIRNTLLIRQHNIQFQEIQDRIKRLGGIQSLHILFRYAVQFGFPLLFQQIQFPVIKHAFTNFLIQPHCDRFDRNRAFDFNQPAICIDGTDHQAVCHRLCVLYIKAEIPAAVFVLFILIRRQVVPGKTQFRFTVLIKDFRNIQLFRTRCAKRLKTKGAQEKQTKKSFGGSHLWAGSSFLPDKEPSPVRIISTTLSRYNRCRIPAESPGKFPLPAPRYRRQSGY